jgi:hypothetical protein
MTERRKMNEVVRGIILDLFHGTSLEGDYFEEKGGAYEPTIYVNSDRSHGFALWYMQPANPLEALANHSSRMNPRIFRIARCAVINDREIPIAGYEWKKR